MANMTLNSSTKMINIVLISDCIANLTGGAEKQIYELAKRLDKTKYKVTVISLDCLGQANGEWFTSIGCAYQRFRVVRIYGLSGLLQGIRFYNFLKKERIDIVQTYHFSSDIWATFWAKLAGVRMIISNRRDMGFWRKPWHIHAYRLVNRWVSKIIVVSNSIRDMVLSTEGVAENKIEVIYNGVELPKNTAVPDIAPLKNNIVIMHVASLSPVKGHVFLLEAFKKIISQIKDVKLVLIGEDMLNGTLQSKAVQMGLKEDVLFLGERKDVSSLLTVADITVLPSLSEGMSNSILEYMAAAKPVIATNVGGNPELIQDGFNGLLIEKENVEELSHALLKLIQDNNLRQIMGQNGFSMVKTKFTMDAMIGHYDRLYKEIASSPCGAPRNDTLKVLHLVSSGGFFGAERVILNLASRQNNGEIISWVGAINNQHNPHLEIIEEAKNSNFKTAVFDSCSQIDLTTISSLRKFLKVNSIDILHTHNYKSDITGFLATRLTGVKWVATMHGWISGDSKLRRYESLDRFVLKFADRIVCVAQKNLDMLLNTGINKRSLAVIDNGIDVMQFSSGVADQNLKKSLGLAVNDSVISIVGRLGEEKGHKVLFKAISTILPQFPVLKCLVVGDGPLMSELKELARVLGLSRHIIFTGNRKDMPEIYKFCDILVNASFTEGLPMTILEAMASQVTVIATSVGAVPNVIKNEINGLLLKPGDPDALSLALTDLLNDADKRKAFARQAYKDVIEHFSQERMAGKYLELYQGMLK